MIKKVRDYVLEINQKYKDEAEDKYDFWDNHIKFVVQRSLELAEIYKADKELVEIGALLHDIALMSRELIIKYPQIYQYSTIWMEDITHVTKKGSETFTLSSTNKLLKQYPYTTGLKTGSTDKAKYCLSATARRNDMDMIAVIMAAPDTKTRFKEVEI